MVFDPSGAEPPNFTGPKAACVRDVSWHSKVKLSAYSERPVLIRFPGARFDERRLV
jgi:hypothetical protein